MPEWGIINILVAFVIVLISFSIIMQDVSFVGVFFISASVVLISWAVLRYFAVVLSDGQSGVPKFPGEDLLVNNVRRVAAEKNKKMQEIVGKERQNAEMAKQAFNDYEGAYLMREKMRMQNPARYTYKNSLPNPVSEFDLHKGYKDDFSKVMNAGYGAGYGLANAGYGGAKNALNFAKGVGAGALNLGADAAKVVAKDAYGFAKGVGGDAYNFAKFGTFGQGNKKNGGEGGGGGKGGGGEGGGGKKKGDKKGKGGGKAKKGGGGKKQNKGNNGDGKKNFFNDYQKQKLLSKPQNEGGRRLKPLGWSARIDNDQADRYRRLYYRNGYILNKTGDPIPPIEYYAFKNFPKKEYEILADPKKPENRQSNVIFDRQNIGVKSLRKVKKGGLKRRTGGNKSLKRYTWRDRTWKTKSLPPPNGFGNQQQQQQQQQQGGNAAPHPARRPRTRAQARQELEQEEGGGGLAGDN